MKALIWVSFQTSNKCQHHIPLSIFLFQPGCTQHPSQLMSWSHKCFVILMYLLIPCIFPKGHSKLPVPFLGTSVWEEWWLLFISCEATPYTICHSTTQVYCHKKAPELFYTIPVGNCIEPTLYVSQNCNHTSTSSMRYFYSYSLILFKSSSLPKFLPLSLFTEICCHQTR